MLDIRRASLDIIAHAESAGPKEKKPAQSIPDFFPHELAESGGTKGGLVYKNNSLSLEATAMVTGAKLKPVVGIKLAYNLIQVGCCQGILTSGS